MAKLIKCPSCEKKIYRDSKKCNWCSYVLTPGDRIDAVAQDPPGSTSPTGTGGTILIAAIIVVFIGVAITTRDSGPGKSPKKPGVLITATEYGDDWPFPDHPEAHLSCKRIDDRRQAVIVKLGNKRYGLNGTAMSNGYPDARMKMAKHPQYDTFELKGSHEIIQRGQDLCEREGG